ncbi:MAG TPA: peptidase E [Puia sp.]|jgi:peptidase E|nr:peptidase E [Puia sp.]
MTTIKRQVIAMGGGGFSMEPENPLLDQYVINQARKPHPSVCFFPHATDDAVRYAFNFFNAFNRLDVRPTYLSLFTPPTRDLESFLLEQDIIYVGGGNTKSMMALWREWKLDELLLKAYQRGVILAGISAGANCWFQQCSTDSLPGQLTMLPCLGILKGSFCPHYDGERERRPSLHKLIGEGRMVPGYAADDGAAVHFINDEVSHAVSSRPSAKAYKVSLKNAQISEEMIETRYLGM